MSDLFEVTEEPGKVFICRFRGEGPLDGTTMRSVLQLMLKTMQADPDTIWVNDLGKHTGISSEARNATSELDVKWKFRAVVFVGGTLTIRAMVNMIMRAMVVLGRYQADIQTFKDEAAMREWLKRQPSRA